MSGQTLLQSAFWACAAAVGYTYIGYPGLLWVISRLFGRPPEEPAGGDANLPSAALLIAAYNEEAVIEKRICNALAMDYPREKFQIVIGSDGSSDNTALLVGRCIDSRVRLLDYRQRRGKASVLNSAMAMIDAQIVLLSDANTEVDPAAARRLVRWFADPSVGVVCGRLILIDGQTGQNGDGLYWKYETFLKRCEGNVGALLGSNGAIYAIRRELYQPIPWGTIVDDFVIPLLARLRTNCRIVYDYEAVAREETAEDVRAEFHRRARIGAGGFQSIVLLWRLLNPKHGWIAFSFFSHKMLRWLCPFFLLGSLVASLLLWHRPLYRLLLITQAGFYAASLVVTVAPPRLRIPRLLRFASMFSSMNAALLAGFWRWAMGRQGSMWRRTSRGADSCPIQAGAADNSSDIRCETIVG